MICPSRQATPGAIRQTTYTSGRTAPYRGAALSRCSGFQCRFRSRPVDSADPSSTGGATTATTAAAPPCAARATPAGRCSTCCRRDPHHRCRARRTRDRPEEQRGPRLRPAAARVARLLSPDRPCGRRARRALRVHRQEQHPRPRGRLPAGRRLDQDPGRPHPPRATATAGSSHTRSITSRPATRSAPAIPMPAPSPGSAAASPAP